MAGLGRCPRQVSSTTRLRPPQLDDVRRAATVLAEALSINAETIAARLTAREANMVFNAQTFLD
eukprot:8695313-Lingulodinium_polyedra.AAC.1